MLRFYLLSELMMKRQQGFLLVTAVIIVVIFGILSAALVSMFIRTSDSARHLQAIPATSALAESGLEQGKKNITEPVISNRQSCANISYTSGSTLTTGTAQASRSQSSGNSINPHYSYSTLTTAITSNTTPSSIVVSDSSVFAPRGRVMIGRETFQYRSIGSATSLDSISRAQDGSIALSHPIGSQVSQYQCTLSGTGSVGTATASREYQQGVQQPIAYAAGTNGTLLRWNSDTSELAWQAVSSGTTNNFKGISLQNYHSGWAVGDSTNGTVFNLARLQGNSWANVGITDTTHAVNLNAVYTTSSNEAWAVGDPASNSLIIYNWVRNGSNDNTNWCIMPCNSKTLTVSSSLINAALYAIKMYDIDGDGFADRGFAAGVTAGQGGGNGGGHGNDNNGQGEEHCSAQGLSHGGCGGQFSEDGTGTTGGGIILYYSGTGWTSVTAAPLNYSLPATIGQILDLDMTPYGNSAPVEAFFVGRTSSNNSPTGIITRLRMSGGAASWNTTNNNFAQILKGVSVIDTNGDGFADFGCAVGNAGLVVTFDGNMNTTSTIVNAAINLNAVVVLSSTDIWVAGDSGARFHYDGTSWVQFNDGLTSNKLYGISKVSSKNSPFSDLYDLFN
ncbi:type II secretion system GspH family protein [bacterium]|nr:type II secretion system GspH family protein [bacterium]